MLNTTLARLRCPASKKKSRSVCGSTLKLDAARVDGKGPIFDVLTGSLECTKCQARYPILGGVAVLVADVEDFLLAHVKGIMGAVAESELPREFRREMKAAHSELMTEHIHIEDDLEAERVISLYLMNHYLSATPSKKGDAAWWAPQGGGGSPLIDSLVREYWDQGPLARIERQVVGLAHPGSVVELGCGVGGLATKLRGKIKSYLGLDSSFASIALARHLTLGAPYRGKIRIPEDLLGGPVSREVQLEVPAQSKRGGHTDFVVGDLDAAPVARGEWDLTLALNAIDMLEEPGRLPELQAELLKKDGIAIQSCPYIWHEVVARKLRARLPREIGDSARAAEWLYEKAGFKIRAREAHVPWLFFKHVRQLEIYSVHLFVAQRT